MSDEIFEIVNEDGEVIGFASRSECHSNPELLHQVAHVLVVNSKDQICLQLRPAHKDVQPNKWDTSVGGHVDPGEAPAEAAVREMREELGIEGELTFLYRYVWRSSIESELVSTYLCHFDGELNPDPHELAEAKWWTESDVNEKLATGLFTENFELEWANYQNYKCQG